MAAAIGSLNLGAANLVHGTVNCSRTGQGLPYTVSCTFSKPFSDTNYSLTTYYVTFNQDNSGAASSVRVNGLIGGSWGGDYFTLGGITKRTTGFDITINKRHESVKNSGVCLVYFYLAYE